jgi:signal transduction histidine kinase
VRVLLISTYELGHEPLHVASPAAGPDGSTTGSGQTALALFHVIVLLVPARLVGRFVRRHGARATAFRELAALAAAAQDAHTAEAIADERTRIGSELQDIIAHSISAMVIQAGSARLLLRSDPGRARDSIMSVEETGRQALSDLRRLLGILRNDDDPRALSPQPGLGQVTGCRVATRRPALACERQTIGDPIDLTPA